MKPKGGDHATLLVRQTGEKAVQPHVRAPLGPFPGIVE
jgi:hypothetical protein